MNENESGESQQEQFDNFKQSYETHFGNKKLRNIFNPDGTKKDEGEIYSNKLHARLDKIFQYEQDVFKFQSSLRPDKQVFGNITVQKVIPPNQRKRAVVHKGSVADKFMDDLEENSERKAEVSKEVLDAGRKAVREILESNDRNYYRSDQAHRNIMNILSIMDQGASLEELTRDIDPKLLHF